MGFLPKDYFEQTKEYRPSTTTATFTKPKSETRKKLEKTVGGALKVIDAIETPYYALMGMGKDIIGGEAGFNPIKSAKAGIKERAGFGDVLTEAGWQPESLMGKITKGGVSFVGSVLLDPITYLSLGAGKGIQVAGKVLSKKGEGLFIKELRRITGIKTLKTFKDVKALGIGNKISHESYERALKIVKGVADKNPDIYYNPTALRYFGKEIPATSSFLKNTNKVVKKGLNPLLSIKVVRETPVLKEGIRTIQRTEKSLGEMFSVGWDILHSRRLTESQKTIALKAKESARVNKAVQEAENIYYVRNLFKGLNNKRREQVAFETEKMLGMDDIKALEYIDGIKDVKIKEIVSTLRQKMKDIWNEEVKLGLRKADDKAVPEGYIKRILTKGMNPEDVNTGIYNSRELGKMTIEEAKQAYKEGKIDYMFETDASKAMLARMNESTALKIKKEMIDGLSRNNLLNEMPKDVTLRNPNKVPFDFFGKTYEVYPELAKELQVINPKLVDTGLKSFWGFYDELQNAWKLSVTSLWMSFHTRNAMSNVFLGWLGGNKNPLTYSTAFKVQNYARRIKAGKEAVDETIKIGARQFKLSEVYKLAAENGVISSGWLGKDMIERLAIHKSDLSFWTRQPQRLGTAVENNARIALFIDSLSKGDDVATATMKVKKFLFDYGDLTEFERTVMKRILPFYTWLRKNIPLQMEQLIKQPAKYAGVWHAKEGIESMSAAKEEQYLPEWMREDELYVRLPNKLYWSPDLPFQDLAKLALKDNVFRTLISGTSPLIKGFFEVAANKDIFRGKPLANQNLPSSKLLREKLKREFLNNMRFTTMWKRATDEDRDTFTKFLDFVFGLNVTPFDVQKGRQMYMQKQQGEQKALQELENKEPIFSKFKDMIK